MLFGNTSSRSISNLVLYPRSGFGGKIFVLGSIRFNRKSIDSRFLQIQYVYGRTFGDSVIQKYFREGIDRSH